MADGMAGNQATLRHFGRIGTQERRNINPETKSGRAPEINLKASQHRAWRSLMRFSWPNGPEAPAGAIRVLRASYVRRMRRRLRCAAGCGGYDTAPSLTRQGMRPLMKANNPRSTTVRHRPRWARKDEDLAFELIAGRLVRDSNGRVLSTEYLKPGSNRERVARAAMARVLRNPDRELSIALRFSL
jgi:hypothetical protein